MVVLFAMNVIKKQLIILTLIKMEYLKKIWKWLVYSSANKEKISLTIKGVGLALIPYVAGFAPLIGLNVSGLPDLVGNVAELVGVLLTGIGLVGVALGLFRKIFIGIQSLKKNEGKVYFLFSTYVHSRRAVRSSTASLES
mgnify:CR=1 FL=1